MCGIIGIVSSSSENVAPSIYVGLCPFNIGARKAPASLRSTRNTINAKKWEQWR